HPSSTWGCGSARARAPSSRCRCYRWRSRRWRRWRRSTRPASATATTDMVHGLRLSVSVLTRLPMRPPVNPAKAVVGAAMAWAPIVGLALGGLASGVLVLTSAAVGQGATLLPAALAVTSLVLMTGALHLDGLADSADALGVRGGPARAREVAKQPATGAFGVSAIAVILLLDVVAVATAAGQGRGVTALVVGC